VRLDKWLWAARHYKTRALAAEAIGHGRVRVNGLDAKPGRDLKVGDLVSIRREGFVQQLHVVALSLQRGPAERARTLYQETEESLAAARQAAEARRQGIEPALAMAQGRPTKKDRRQLADWQRWRADLG
jgi:ribosome-associated heat shock protein Hsp15